MTDSSERFANVRPATEAAVQKAVVILRRGGLVAFPTETVYGLGADAENPAAVRAMFAAKGRPPDHPVIVHLAEAAQLDRYAAAVPPAATSLAAAFWPGPMTLILPRTSRVSDLVTGGLNTVGLRVPSHPVAQALLRQFGGALAAPSANRFGRVSPTRAAHVAADLADRVDLILDGGECAIGLESTIIDLTGEHPAILRPGAVTAEQVAQVLQDRLREPPADAPRVSGSLPSHYAPQARVEVVAATDLAHRAGELSDQGCRVALFSAKPPNIDRENVIWLPIPTSQAELAQVLYSLLRKADELGCDVALATLPDDRGLGTAISDRLRRAAGPRD